MLKKWQCDLEIIIRNVSHALHVAGIISNNLLKDRKILMIFSQFFYLLFICLCQKLGLSFGC